jgi:hypothetical protein
MRGKDSKLLWIICKFAKKYNAKYGKNSKSDRKTANIRTSA